MRKKPSQSLIKTDDLYWNEYEGKYVAISEEEIDAVLMALYADNITPRTEDTAFQAVKWAEEARVNYLILQGILSGRIRMHLPKVGEEIVFYEEPSLPELEEEQNYDEFE